jgi:thiol-disulfide isomerase/thioredoxin
MNRSFTNLILLVALCVALLTMTGCPAPATNTANSSAASVPAANNPAASNAKASEYPPLASALADAELENLDGTTTKVSDRKGKVVLLNLWGIWCIPCIAEMPHLISLQNMYGDAGLEIIGMNVGADDQGTPEEMDEIKKFAAKQKLNYTLVRSPEPVTRQVYTITGKGVVPQSLLIDREGRLRGVFIGGGGEVINKMKDTVGKVVNE